MYIYIYTCIYIYIYTYINHMEHLYVSVKVSVYDIPMKSSWPLARSIVRPSGDLPFTLAGKSIYFLVIDRFARSGKQSHWAEEAEALQSCFIDDWIHKCNEKNLSIVQNSCWTTVGWLYCSIYSEHFGIATTHSGNLYPLTSKMEWQSVLNKARKFPYWVVIPPFNSIIIIASLLDSLYWIDDHTDIHIQRFDMAHMLLEINMNILISVWSRFCSIES